MSGDGDDGGTDSNSLVRSLVKGSGILFVGFVLELGLSFGAKWLIATWLGRTNYGAVSLGVLLVANVSTIVVLGTDTGIARYLPRLDERRYRRNVLASAYGVVMPITVATGVAVFVLADPISTRLLNDPAIAPVLRVFAISIPFASLMKLGIGGVRGMQFSLPKVYVRNLLQPISRFALVVVVLLASAGAVGVAWAYVGSYVLAGLLATYYVVTKTPILSREGEFSFDRDLFRFSGPIGVSKTGKLVLSGIGLDAFMIAFFVGSTGDVGDYNVVFPLAKLIIVVFSSFSFLFMPVISELDAGDQREEMRRLFQVTTKWIVLLTLPMFLGMFAFPRRVIVLTFGAEYAGTPIALTVLAVGFFAHALAGPAQGILESTGRPRAVMVATLAGAAVNVVVNILLIPEYSLLGAAVGTTAAYLVINGLLLYYVYRETGMHPYTGSLLRPLVVASAVAGVIFWSVREFLTLSTLSLLVLVGPLAVVYTLVVLHFGGIEEEEVMLLLSVEERFGLNLGPVKRVAERLM